MTEISVVIPAKNRAHTLPLCLESVLRQSYRAREVVVVDDHSTDNTRAVVESFGHRGVRYVALEQGDGAQAARNQGVHCSRYPWIAFQDSDDRWMEQKLQRQVAALAAAGDAESIVVHTGGRMVDEGTGAVRELKTATFDGQCYERLLLRAGPMFPGLLVHRRALEKVGFLDVQCPSFQEWDTAIRLARICSFVHIKQPLFDWIRHGSETISKDSAKGLRGHEYVLRKHRSEIVRVHGARGWRLAVAELVANSLSFGEVAVARNLADENLPLASRLFVRAAGRTGGLPRGGARVLRTLSRLHA